MSCGLAILVGLLDPFLVRVMLMGLYSFFKGPLLSGAPYPSGFFSNGGESGTTKN